MRGTTRTLRQAVEESWQYRELMVNLTQRELRSRYRRSFLGWGWSLLQPALMTAVYAVILGKFLRIVPEPGHPSGIHLYAVFLLAGLLPWNFFNGSLTGGMGAVANAGSLITRVWFPREIIPLANIAAMGFTFLIEMCILSIFILVATGHIVFHLIPVALVLLVLEGLFVAGITYWLAAVNVRFRDIEYITSVFLLAFFYVTPIIYAISFVPTTEIVAGITVRQVVLLNPMARFAMAYQNIFYDVRMPGLNTFVALVVSSLLVFLLGFRFFVRRADRFAEAM